MQPEKFEHAFTNTRNSLSCHSKLSRHPMYLQCSLFILLSCRTMIKSKNELGHTKIGITKVKKTRIRSDYYTKKQREVLEKHYLLLSTNSQLDYEIICKEISLSKPQIRMWMKNRRQRGNYKGKKQYSAEQVEILEVYYRCRKYPLKVEKQVIADTIGVSIRRIQKWFQTRRDRGSPLMFYEKAVSLCIENPVFDVLVNHLEVSNFEKYMEDHGVFLHENCFNSIGFDPTRVSPDQYNDSDRTLSNMYLGIPQCGSKNDDFLPIQAGEERDSINLFQESMKESVDSFKETYGTEKNSIVQSLLNLWVNRNGNEEREAENVSTEYHLKSEENSSFLDIDEFDETNFLDPFQDQHIRPFDLWNEYSSIETSSSSQSF